MEQVSLIEEGPHDTGSAAVLRQQPAKTGFFDRGQWCFSIAEIVASQVQQGLTDKVLQNVRS